MQKITIVSPMRNEAPTIPELSDSLERLVNQINLLSIKVEVIFMDNASIDNTIEKLKLHIPASSEMCQYRVIRNHRDVGLQASLMTSMEIATGDAFVVLHSDLEDPPELILEFVRAWTEGNKSIVGVMSSRSDPKLYQWTSKLFYRILKLSSDSCVVPDSTDFFLLDRSIYKDIATRPRTNQYIRGTVSSYYGIDIQFPYKRRRRKFGKTNFNFAKRYEVGVDAILALGTRIPRYLALLSGSLFVLSLFVWPIVTALSFLGYRANYLLCLLFNLITLIALISSLGVEILFRVYNYLINAPRNYEFDEIDLQK